MLLVVPQLDKLPHTVITGEEANLILIKKQKGKEPRNGISSVHMNVHILLIQKMPHKADKSARL